MAKGVPVKVQPLVDVLVLSLLSVRKGLRLYGESVYVNDPPFMITSIAIGKLCQCLVFG